MTVYSHLRRISWIAGGRAMLLPARAYRRGQAMVEFALIAALSMVVLLVGIQFAIIGQAALAVTQASYLGARAASVNATMTSSQLNTTLQNLVSPTITGAVANLTLTNASDPTCAGGTRTFGCGFNVTITYDATSKLFLPASWSILGSNRVIVFPTSLTSTQSAMTE